MRRRRRIRRRAGRAGARRVSSRPVRDRARPIPRTPIEEPGCRGAARTRHSCCFGRLRARVNCRRRAAGAAVGGACSPTRWWRTRSYGGDDHSWPGHPLRPGAPNARGSPNPGLRYGPPRVAARRRCDVSYSIEVDGESQLSASSLVESLDLDERPLHARSVRRRHGPHQEAAKAANGVAVQGREMTQRRRPLRGWRRSTTRSTRAQERNPTSQHSATRTGRL